MYQLNLLGRIRKNLMEKLTFGMDPEGYVNVKVDEKSIRLIVKADEINICK